MSNWRSGVTTSPPVSAAGLAQLPWAPHRLWSAATGEVVALALAPVVPDDAGAERAEALHTLAVDGAFPAPLERPWVHRLRAAVGRDAERAEIVPPPRTCPGILWLEIDRVATVLDDAGIVTELTWFGDVGCRINAHDLATSRASIATLAETGIAFVVLEAAVMRLARSDLATAIMTRSFTRRAHINGMAVVAEAPSGWKATERAADLGVDLLVDRTPRPLDGRVDNGP